METYYVLLTPSEDQQGILFRFVLELCERQRAAHQYCPFSNIAAETKRARADAQPQGRAETLLSTAEIDKIIERKVKQLLAKSSGSAAQDWSCDLLLDSPSWVNREDETKWTAVEFVQRLGYGGFGRVLHVKVDGEDFALKVPSGAAVEYSLRDELRMIKEVAGKCKNVPLSIERVTDRRCRALLLMAPVGLPDSRRQWTKALILDLLDGYRALCQQLSASGSRPVVHRDIKPSNIVLVRDGEYGERLVLIDWGCVVKEGTYGVYAGAVPYAAHRLYQNKATDPRWCTRYTASCVDDYGSFVLTALAAFFMRKGMAECGDELQEKGSSGVCDMEATEWLEFWQQRLPQCWWEMYTSLTQETDADEAYKRVRAFLDGWLPNRPLWS